MKIYDITGEKILLEIPLESLRWADLRDANLCGADLRDANLRWADLRRANLRDADLRRANLRGADLRRANLRRANLCGADLCGADLRDANLCGADLCGADLRGADLQIDQIAHTRILPEGEIIGWKKLNGGIIAKLIIPADSERSHATGRKCRARYAVCSELSEGTEGITNIHGPITNYRLGERVECDAWDADWRNECSGGIHFFITKKEAEEYQPSKQA